MIIILNVIPQVVKQTIESLIVRKANFRYSSNKNEINILDVKRFYSIDDTRLGISFRMINIEMDSTIYFNVHNIDKFEISGE